MKKFVLLFLAVVSVKHSFSQDPMDMIASLKAIGEGVVYTEYWDVVSNGGKTAIGEKRYVVTIKPVTNRFGKIVGFVGEEAGGKKQIDYNYMYNKFDNYTHPSYITGASNHAKAIINGVIFDFEHFQSITSFEIDKVWIPKVPKEKSGDAVFQGSKMSDLKSKDLYQVAKDYFAAMKKIQEANPYSETEQAEADAMKFTVDSTQLTYNNKNAAYWNSEEGKRKLDELRNTKPGDGWVTIKNTGKKEMHVMTDRGTSSHIPAGSSNKWPCSADIYYCSMDGHNTWNVKGSLILKGREQCGKVVEVKND